MPESITVCVIALTQNDYGGLDPTAQSKLAGLPEIYDFKTSGKPYAGTPDDWQPFNTTLSIQAYLKQSDLEANLLSNQLYALATFQDVLKNTHLYVIDPFVLMHSNKADRLVREVQTAIYSADKAFCIILPEDIPSAVRKEIVEICYQKLNSLKSILQDKDSGEWIENADRLNKFLKRLARQMSAKPNPAALELVQAILNSRGVPEPGLKRAPQLLT